MSRKNWLGKVVKIEWADAFSDSETHPDDLTDEYIWHSYGVVLRQTPDYITVASDVGGETGKEKERQVSATTVLMCMVVSITEFAEVS